MPTSPNQRLKLLFLMRILLDKTDGQNPLTVAEIITALGEYGIKAERKTVYSDLELLRQFGIDIEIQRGKSVGYYVAERQFELPELKLLVDAVQSSRIITQKKSDELIKKLSSLTSAAQAKQLQRQVFFAERARTINETVFYSIDQIHYAISENRKISFKYFDYDVDKNRIYRKQGELYQNSPVTLCWNNDNYYLIAYSKKYDSLTHYRVDRMSAVNVLCEDADTFDKERCNIAAHVRHMFGMFDGENVRATLSFEVSLVNAVFDHFGKSARITSSEDGWITVNADVSVSPVFFAWIFQFGKRAKIIAPDSLIDGMRELIEQNIQKYGKL